jgi:hypothetical protein
MTDTNHTMDQQTDNNTPSEGFKSPDHVEVVTWEIVRKQRDNMLLQAEQMYRFDSPPQMLKDFADYKQALRDLPENSRIWMISARLSGQ